MFRIRAIPLRPIRLALRALLLVVGTLLRPLTGIVGCLFLLFLVLLPRLRFALRPPRLEVRDILVVLPLALRRIGLALRRRCGRLGIALRILIRLVAQTLLVLAVFRLGRVLARRSLRILQRLLLAIRGAIAGVRLRVEPALQGMGLQRDLPHHVLAVGLEALGESQAIVHEDRVLAALDARLGLRLDAPVDDSRIRQRLLRTRGGVDRPGRVLPRQRIDIGTDVPGMTSGVCGRRHDGEKEQKNPESRHHPPVSG